MTRLIALFVCAISISGCHAPTPSFDLFSPYAPPRVPPPRTGSYGQADTRLGAVAPTYYEQTVSTTGQAPQTSAAVAKAAKNQPWKTTDSGQASEPDAQLVSHTEDAAPSAAQTGDSVRIVENAQPEKVAKVEFNGMHVNDAMAPHGAVAQQAANDPRALFNVSSGSALTYVPNTTSIAASPAYLASAAPSYAVAPASYVASSTVTTAPVSTPTTIMTAPTAATMVGAPQSTSPLGGATMSSTPVVGVTPQTQAGQVVTASATVPASGSNTTVVSPPATKTAPQRFNPAEQLIEISSRTPSAAPQSLTDRMRGMKSTTVAAGAVEEVKETATPAKEPAVHPAASSDGWKAR